MEINVRSASIQNIFSVVEFDTIFVFRNICVVFIPILYVINNSLTYPMI